MSDSEMSMEKREKINGRWIMYHTRADCATLPQQIHEPTYQPGDKDEGKVNAVHVMHPNLEKNIRPIVPHAQ